MRYFTEARVPRTVRVNALIGVILLLGLVGLGVLAKTAEVTRHDLHVDLLIQPWRFPAATAVFLTLTNSASEAVGVVGLVVGVASLVVRGRRWDAFRLLGMAATAWSLAIAVKIVVDRSRPPASIWALTPDSSGSFPSGHDTTACVLVLVALLALGGTGRIRAWATALAVVFAAAVGLSRVYLGDHYPTDVLGSWLTVAAAAMLVAAATDLPVVRRLAARVLRDTRAWPPLPLHAAS